MPVSNHTISNPIQEKVVYNPNEVPTEELPTIYGYKYRKIKEGFYHCALLADDGTMLWYKHAPDDDHEEGELKIFREPEAYNPELRQKLSNHYPNGYTLEYVNEDDIAAHVGLIEAIRKHRGKITPFTPDEVKKQIVDIVIHCINALSHPLTLSKRESLEVLAREILILMEDSLDLPAFRLTVHHRDDEAEHCLDEYHRSYENGMVVNNDKFIHEVFDEELDARKKKPDSEAYEWGLML